LCKLQIALPRKAENDVGDWSDYFEDFPEEDPANYVNGRFDPEKARELREQSARLSTAQQALDQKIASIVDEGRRREAEKKK
jgi:hypothetical protein